GVVAQGGQDARHQAVAALGALVAVDIGAHRYVVAVPAARGELPAQQLGRVDLHHDLAVDAVTGVEVQVAVRRAGEAVHAGVRAAPVRVDRPLQGQAGGRRHPVEERAGPDLVDGDAAERRRVEGTGGDRLRLEQRGVGPAVFGVHGEV